MTITSFYGASGAEAADSGASDITSVLKSRRLAAARAAEERARQHREEMFRSGFKKKTQTSFFKNYQAFPTHIQTPTSYKTTLDKFGRCVRRNDEHDLYLSAGGTKKQRK